MSSLAFTAMALHLCLIAMQSGNSPVNFWFTACSFWFAANLFRLIFGVGSENYKGCLIISDWRSEGYIYWVIFFCGVRQDELFKEILIGIVHCGLGLARYGSDIFYVVCYNIGQS